ncbi:MAG: prolyl oligopeptidase family serine peptidase, partial [Myxococcota bacterium]
MIPYEDAWNTSVIGFGSGGSDFYAVESIGRDKAALVQVEFATGKRTVIGESEKADVSGVAQHPVTRQVEAFSANYLRVEWKALDDSFGDELAFLKGKIDGELDIVSRTKSDRRWVVARSRAEGSTEYYLFDREKRSLKRLFSVRPELENYELQSMRALELESRDGLTLVSYLTLPPGSDANGDGVPDSPVPLALAVHGGPWARDSYGYNSWHQWLANRSYAVLSVNFRSSIGFGKSFVTAGDNEWSKKMHNDLLDAVDWAVNEGITTPEKVAIMGGSYGGYATLVGLTFTPNTFACGVDIVGMSNMRTTIDAIPPYWASFFEQLARAVGDPRTEAGKAQLREISPLFRADQIVKPLLIGQGANDPRV